MCQVAHRLSVFDSLGCTLGNGNVQIGQESISENEPSRPDGTPSVSKLRVMGCVPADIQCGPLASIALPRPPMPNMAGRRCPVPADQEPAWPRPCRHWRAGDADLAGSVDGVFDTSGTG